MTGSETITVNYLDLIQSLGAKEAELILLRRRVQELQEQLAHLQDVFKRASEGAGRPQM